MPMHLHSAGPLMKHSIPFLCRIMEQKHEMLPRQRGEQFLRESVWLWGICFWESLQMNTEIIKMIIVVTTVSVLRALVAVTLHSLTHEWDFTV